MMIWSLCVVFAGIFGASLRGETLSINQESVGRLRIVFQNNSLEDVLVSIHHMPLDPLPGNLVKIGEWRHFFPQQLTSPLHPLHIVIVGALTGTLTYTLDIKGNPSLVAIPACRAYGSLFLMRGDEVMQSIGASALEDGIILRFEKYYELYVEPLKWRSRNRKTGKEQPTCLIGTKNCPDRRTNSCAPKNTCRLCSS